MASLIELLTFKEKKDVDRDYYEDCDYRINENKADIDRINERINSIAEHVFVNYDDIVVFFKINLGRIFYKEERFIIDEYDFYGLYNEKIFWTLAYLNYSIYKETDSEYNEEELKIINNCEETITTFFQENHLLSKDFSLKDIKGFRIFSGETEILYDKIYKKMNKLELAEKVNNAFKNNEDEN